MSNRDKKEDLSNNLQAMFEGVFGTREHTNNFREKDRTENQGMAILSYLIPPIPFFVERHSEYVKFHSNQGMNLLVWFILIKIFLKIVEEGFPWDFITSALNLIFNLLYLGLAIFGVMSAVKNKARELPLVSKVNLINIVGNLFRR